MTALIIGIESHTLSPEETHLLKHPAVCGVILFKRNYSDRSALLHLTRAIKSAAGDDFLITVDQEGGRVARFGPPFTALPALGVIGAHYASDPDRARALAHLHAWMMATEVLNAGVDLSWAPVVDIDNGSDVIGDRAFSARPGVVGALAEIYCGAMRHAGMRTSAKHFPGHGTVKADSHHELPQDDRDMDALAETDLLPFNQLIEAGAVDALMMSHVIYAHMCQMPAGYSDYWNREVARETLGFTGLTVSDDLGMKAAECIGDVDERYQACRDAGIDIALLCEPALVHRLLRELGCQGDGQRFAQLCGQPQIDPRAPFWESKRWQLARLAFNELMKS